jgi:hypothetical protein
MLARCAKVREEFQNKQKRGRRSEFTENVARVRQHLRISGLKLEQPGGRGVLRGGGEGRGGCRAFIGEVVHQIGQEIARLKRRGELLRAAITRESFGRRKTTVTWPAHGGPLSARKEKGEG